MFSVWGSRTASGALYSGRNLDWNQDTGINKNKLVTVFNPDDGKNSHLTLGFAGLYGALTGMSSQGISVMEANLEENEITFNGFPWILRLRYVMENAVNITQGKEIWESTDNTVGFNHMIASANDASPVPGSISHPALALETMFNYTAYFQDDDPREQNAVYTSGNTTVQIGFPLEEALWRTNHGYDPTIREHYEWSQSPTSWSMERYMFAYEAFTSYEQLSVEITEVEAMNITSILGDKGSDPYVCPTSPNGSNILSVTYRAGTKDLWVAWEDGTGTTWLPAACTIYVHFDMSVFWPSSSLNTSS